MSGELRQPTSHPAGRRPHHGPASGPAKLRGMAPLCTTEREAPVVSSGNHHLNPTRPAGATGPGGTVGLSGGLGGGALRDKTLGGEPPQRDEHLAHAPAGLPEPMPEPRGDAAARLVAEPKPGALDHSRSQTAVASLRNALLPVDAAAREGCTDKAGIGSKCLGGAESQTTSLTSVVAICAPTPRWPTSRWIIASAFSACSVRATASRCASRMEICVSTSSSRSSTAQDPGLGVAGNGSPRAVRSSPSRWRRSRRSGS